MPELAARLRLLRSLPRPQRVAALRSVLPWASGDELEAFAAEAIEFASSHKDRHALLIDVLRTWPRLSAEARSTLVVVCGNGLADRLDDLSSSAVRPDRRAAAEVAGACVVGDEPSPRDINVRLVTTLHRLASDEGAIAVAALNGLAQAHRRSGDDPEVDAVLDAALAEAADRYHVHRHDGVLRAITDRAHDAGPRVSAWLAQRSDAGHMAMRSLARKQDPREALGRAVTDLGVPSLAPAAISALERAEPDTRATPLADAHLLRARSRDATLGKLRDHEALVGDAWDATLPVEARRGAIEWITRIPMKPTQRVERLRGAIDDPDAGVRLRACLAVRDLPAGPQCDAALRDFAHDPDERVAHAALSTLVTAPSRRRREAHADLFERLAQSPHASVARLASRALDALRLVEVDDDAIRGALASDERSSVLRAIARVSNAGRAGAYAAELVAIADAGDPFCAARAVRALTHVEGEPAGETLLGALGHTDGRVVAEAVEALTAREGGAISMKAFRTSAVARVRANAIMHALRTDDDPGEARGALAEMLRDPRASHRLSALWVTQRSGQTALGERVAELAREDDERAVRARAEVCAGRLLARMRDGWAHGGKAAAG